MKLSHFLYFVLLLTSCNFEPEGLNYIEIEKPSDNHPLELKLSLNEDSIYLYGNTKLSFDLSTFGKEFNLALIRYYDLELTTNKTNYSFTITPKATTNWVDLTIDFYVSTGSGSIADKLKAENYLMSKTWKIKYFDLSKVGLNAGYQIHPDGFLELFMVLPQKAHNAGYGLSKYGNDITVSRISGDTAFFNDKSYCYGSYNYSFWYKFDSENMFNRSVNVNLPQAELKVEAIGLDSCKVSWTKSPLKLYYKVNEIEYKGFDNEFKTSIQLNESKIFSLKVFPPDYLTSGFSSYYISTDFNLGIKTNYFLCYSLEKDKFFISKDLALNYIESSNLPLPTSEPNSQYKSRLNIICSPNGKYVAGYLYSQIYIYDEKLNLSNRISAGVIPNFKPYFSITNDGVFTYQQGTNIVMKNITGSTDWNSFSIAIDSNTNPNVVYFSDIANSIDGKYVCVKELTGFRIFDVSDHQTAKVVYNYPSNDIGAVVAHPNNPGLIYVKQNGIMQLRTCPGFELIKTIDIPINDYYFHSIDPYTNIMLMMKDDYYYFIDPDTSKELLKLKSGSIWNYNVKLVRNQFKTSISVLDLTNYLKK